MRKLLAVILAAAMTVSLAGCGGNAASSGNTWRAHNRCIL